MNDLMPARENSPKLKDSYFEKIGNNVTAHPILEENDAAITKHLSEPPEEPQSFNSKNSESNEKVQTNSSASEYSAGDSKISVDTPKEAKQKPRDKKGSLRRNFSIGNLRQKFKKQHSRSYSESPVNLRKLDISEDSAQPRLFKSENTPENEIPLSPTSPGSDDVFGESKGSKPTTSPFPPRPRLRHTRTLPRLLPSSRGDSFDSDAGSSKEDRMRAVQLWQKACTSIFNYLNFSGSHFIIFWILFRDFIPIMKACVCTQFTRIIILLIILRFSQLT